ncbi:MAG: PaaI family thioesterase [Nitrospirota bacterium]
MAYNRETDDHCFVCGTANPCGLQLRFKADGGKVAASFTSSAAHQGYKGLVHGGILASILDEAMIQAALLRGLSPVTAELSVRFTSPLRVGERARVEAEIVTGGTRLLKAAARLFGADGGAIAEAQAKLIV